jgi:hypothetical protein
MLDWKDSRQLATAPIAPRRLTAIPDVPADLTEFARERLRDDDTTVPVLVKSKTGTGDDRPLGNPGRLLVSRWSLAPTASRFKASCGSSAC